MKQSAVVLALIVAWPVAAGAADVSAVVSQIAQTAPGAMAIVEYTVETETGSSELAGQAVCITSDGVFMTLAISSQLRPEFIKNVRLRPSGVDDKTVPAEYLSMDPHTGVTFVKTTQPHDWKTMRFAKEAKVSAGDLVVSVGLMPGDGSYPPTFGVAYVSNTVRTPNKLVYVTGGSLGSPGSPVLNEQGIAIGIISSQLFMEYETAGPRGTIQLPLRGRQATQFFTPVEEFASSLAQPDKPKHISWLGIIGFDAIPETGIIEVDRPAVMVGQVAPGYPAEKAGLKQRDVIIGMNGKDIEKLGTPELTRENFARMVMRLGVGEPVTFTVIQDGQTKMVSMETVAMPTRPLEAPRYFSKPLALLVRDKVVMDELLSGGQISGDPGVLVAFVVQGAPADKAQIKVNDVINSVNGKPIRDIDLFKKIVEEALKQDPAKALVLGVSRGKQSLALTVEPVPETAPAVQ